MTLKPGIFVCVCILILFTVICMRASQHTNKQMIKTDSFGQVTTKQCNISFYKKIRDTFLSPRTELCPEQQEWGGVLVMMPLIDKNVIKTLVKKGGNYTVCMAKGIAPIKRRCLVYSFGINKDWTFDERAEEEGCEVFSFDPSIGLPPHYHSFNIIFNDKGLWKKDGVIPMKSQLWKVAKFSTLLKESNHTNRTIDILKIDIEEAEHEAIPEMVGSGSLRNVKQILLEYHNFGKYNLEKYYSTYWLLYHYDFVSVAVEEWPHPTCAKKDGEGYYEVYCFIFTFINKQFLKQ